MSKRISRRRLQVLQAQGQDLTQSSGPAMSGSIGTFERTSDLSLYTSEITLDLGNATYPASSYSTAAYKATLTSDITAGATSIGLYYGENLSSSNDLTTQGTAAIAFAAQDVGTTGIVDLDIDADGFYWYLASTGSTSAIYTAGKFVLRFYGYQVPDDIT